jgi:hypothetical protein
MRTNILQIINKSNFLCRTVMAFMVRKTPVVVRNAIPGLWKWKELAILTILPCTLLKEYIVSFNYLTDK